MRKWNKKAEKKAPSSAAKKSWKERKGEKKKENHNKKIIAKQAKERDKEEQKIKRASIRVPTARRIANAIITVCIVVALLVVFNVFRQNHDISKLEQAVQANDQQTTDDTTQNMATRAGVQYFVTQFMQTYLTVESGEEQRKARQDALQSFLAKGLDENAGIQYESLTGKQFYEDSQIVEVKPSGQDTATIQIKATVKHVYTDVKTVKKTIKKNGKKKKQKKKVEETKEETDTVYYQVAVHGSADGYSIVDLPRPYYPDSSESVTVENVYMNKTPADKHQEGVSSFLRSFFESYVNKERANDMRFFFQDSSDAKSLHGAFDFVKLQEVVVYPGKNNQHFVVRSHVLLENPVTGLQSAHGYEFILVQDGKEKYEIVRMKDLTYNIQS